MDRKEEIVKIRKNIIEGLEKSYEKLVAFKRYKNSPLIVEKEEKIIEVAPDKILPTTEYVNRIDSKLKK
ncbi:hypothetical protein RM553_10095 [Zunongwangia sp. F363]|uniref:Uncharacterized protein n=1 Tax=Autumnicola tepida TaxID=3075595 RepID=A0ABU3CA08_9FLAO|nr:hypothetical protein [Zunongwangia sp. F363]MDT0643179.1 hypothetical protein [Zunongwangia sp. F363]